MTLEEVLSLILGGGTGFGVLLGLIQVSPIPVKPWSAIAKALGRAINGEVLQQVSETKTKLEEHIEADGKHTADQHRTRILRFNTECLRHQRHTREDFIDILAEIDEYERYCQAHPEYKNQRCVHAVKNIGRVYDTLLETGDFLAEGPEKQGG